MSQEYKLIIIGFQTNFLFTENSQKIHRKQWLFLADISPVYIVRKWMVSNHSMVIMSSHLSSSMSPLARSLILGYLTFLVSNSSWAHSNSLSRLASLGVDSRFSISSMAAFNSLATCNKVEISKKLYKHVESAKYALWQP